MNGDVDVDGQGYGKRMWRGSEANQTRSPYQYSSCIIKSLNNSTNTPTTKTKKNKSFSKKEWTVLMVKMHQSQRRFKVCDEGIYQTYER